MGSLPPPPARAPVVAPSVPPRAPAGARLAAGLLAAGLAFAVLVAVVQTVRLADLDGRHAKASQDLAEKRADLSAARRSLAGTGAALTVETARATRESASRAAVEAGAALLLAEGRAALLPLGRLDTLERAARACLEAFEGRPDATLAASSQELRASALDLLGEVLLQREKPEEAEEVFRAGVALAALRADGSSALPARRHAAAEAHLRLARALAARGDLAGALESQDEALRRLRALNDQDPQALPWLGALAATLTDTALTLAELTRGADARAHVEEAVQLGKALCARAPEDGLWVRGLAESEGVLGDVHVALGAQPDAEAAYRSALSHLGTLAVRDASVQADQTALLLKLGNVSLRGGHVDASIAVLREALVLAVSLASADPARVDGQERLARVCDALSSALEADGQAEDALAGRREAALTWKRVVTLEGGASTRRSDALRAVLRLGDALVRAGQAEEALEAFREAATWAGALGGDARSEGAQGSDLAESFDRVALTLVLLGRRTEALEAWRGALAAIEPLAKKTPENAFWQADLARIWWHLGTALASVEADRDEGHRALRRAQRLLVTLGETRRTPDYASGWADAVADALRVTSDPPPTSDPEPAK